MCVSLSIADLDSLLTTLRSLGGGEAEGREEGAGLQLLEQMLHSNTFKRAQKVYAKLVLTLSVVWVLRGETRNQIQ